MTTPTHPPRYYCPSCGHETRVEWQQFAARGFWLITCDYAECPTAYRTADEATLADAATLARWRVTQRYDVMTGRRVAA